MTDRRFGPDTTSDEVLEGIDLTGRRAIVTGATGGLGLETARALASRGAEVVLTARSADKGDAAVKAVQAAVPGAAVSVAALELASLESVRRFTSAYIETGAPLHILVCNAAVMSTPFGRTEDGFESQFGVNHLGHFVLIGELMPRLIEGAPSRIVLVSSAGHRFAGIDFDDPNYEHRPYEKWTAYGQSKTANALTAVALDARVGARGVTVNAVHPGAIMTDLGRYLTKADIEALTDIAPGAGEIHWKSIPAGAATTVWCATAPELEGRGGQYCEDCHVAAPIASDDAQEGYAPHARDPEAAERLWQLSESLVGHRFEF